MQFFSIALKNVYNYIPMYEKTFFQIINVSREENVFGKSVTYITKCLDVLL